MENSEIKIMFEEAYSRSAAYDNSKLIGECDFIKENSKWVITHTIVSTGYEGRGIARNLVNLVIEEARKENIKILPLCSYAQKLMSKEEYKDVLYV